MLAVPLADRRYRLFPRSGHSQRSSTPLHDGRTVEDSRTVVIHIPSCPTNGNHESRGPSEKQKLLIKSSNSISSKCPLNEYMEWNGMVVYIMNDNRSDEYEFKCNQKRPNASSDSEISRGRKPCTNTRNPCFPVPSD